MILFLTLIYIGILLLLFKRDVLQPTLFWKLSPVVWSMFLMVALIIPLQFWVPSGPVVLGNHTIPIVPQVAGEVTEVHATSNTPMKQGDVLFKIEPTLYQAAMDDAVAGLELARIRVKQELSLQERNVGKQLDLDRSRAQMAQKQAILDVAKFNLDSTVVRAPVDGYATNVILRPGMRVVAFPLQPSMSYIDTGESIVASLIMQSHLRYIEPDQEVEITFKMYPGEVYAASVIGVIPARATGFESLSGLPVIPQQVTHAPFAVRLKLGEQARALDLPSGATGVANIYSGTGEFAHVIRKVELRIGAIINFINPF